MERDKRSKVVCYLITPCQKATFAFDVAHCLQEVPSRGQMLESDKRMSRDGGWMSGRCSYGSRACCSSHSEAVLSSLNLPRLPPFRGLVELEDVIRYISVSNRQDEVDNARCFEGLCSTAAVDWHIFLHSQRLLECNEAIDRRVRKVDLSEFDKSQAQF